MSLLYSLPHLSVKSLEPQGSFWGYASSYCVDKAQDQIMPGAFTKTLAYWRSSKQRFPHLFFNHDMEEIIGLSQDMGEDEQGLWIKGRLLMDLPQARAVHSFLSQGQKGGLSIGFYPLKTDHHRSVRRIHEVSLKEVSFAPNPCNPEAMIREYKNVCPSIQAALKRLTSTLSS